MEGKQLRESEHQTTEDTDTRSQLWCQLTVLHRFRADEARQTGRLRQLPVLSLVALDAGTHSVSNVVREIVCNIIRKVISICQIISQIIGKIISIV